MRSLRVAAIGLLASGLVTLAACSQDAAAPLAASADPTAAVTGAPTGPVTAELNTGLCLDVWTGSTQAGAAVKLWPCHGGSNQQWTATGAGELRIYNGAMCLDAAGGRGNDGDPLIVWPCNGGANQHWTYTDAGELRGINGKCADIWGAEAYAGADIALYSCHGGSNQKFNAPTASASAAPAPNPEPAPAPPAPTDAAAKVLALMGGVPSVAAVEGLGGAFARYEGDFRTRAEERWATDGARWGDANYYDRAMIFYVWWARTGDSKYLERANAIAVDYRTNFLEPKAFHIEPHESQLDGVALHYLVTGDEASRTAVGRVADRFSGSYYVLGLSNTSGEMENRMQARVLTSFVLANYLKAPSQLGHDWAVRSRDALTRILASQSPDGAYRFTHGVTNQCGYNKPFMVGLLNDALIRYYDLFDRDSRILPAVKKAVDYLWGNNWYAGEQAFTYLEGHCNGDGPTPSADVNNLIVNGFGFVYQQTGDGTYKARGDAVFAGGVNRGWLGTSKHFNQEYTSSYRYVKLRQ